MNTYIHQSEICESSQIPKALFRLPSPSKFLSIHVRLRAEMTCDRTRHSGRLVTRITHSKPTAAYPTIGDLVSHLDCDLLLKRLEEKGYNDCSSHILSYGPPADGKEEEVGDIEVWKVALRPMFKYPMIKCQTLLFNQYLRASLYLPTVKCTICTSNLHSSS